VAHIPREMQDLPRSGIRALMDLAWAQPGPVIRLEVGQPDRIPPEHIRQAMADSVMAGETGYTPNAGIPELREACAVKLRHVNGIDVEPSQVLISAGSMQGLSVSILGLTTAGDEILVPDPGWPNYAMAARIARATPVAYPLRAESGYLPDPEKIEPLITDRTRILIDPGNLEPAWHGLTDLVLSPADAGRGRPFPDLVLAAFLRTAAVAGVAGLLLRDADPDEIVAALRAAGQGLTVLDPRAVPFLTTDAAPRTPPDAGEPLTPREREILQLIAQGLPNKSIALELGISEHTVKFHVGSILDKLGASSRAEALARAARAGLIVL